MEICKTCKSYNTGNSICKDGFPLPYDGDPLCLRDDYSESVLSRFFDNSGKTLFRPKEEL